ncbi:hypothetical protein [Streptomyces sp. NBC_01236]|nr:hypothetical protein OG324_00250 [Streptomyces sp. NBC_01236]
MSWSYSRWRPPSSENEASRQSEARTFLAIDPARIQLLSAVTP